jgi:branched-chain amino acid transport system permease protein
MSAFVEYLVSGIALGCGFALMASGFVAIFRVTEVINFAQGTLAVLGGFVAYSALTSAGLPQGLAEALGVLAAGLAGLAFGVVAIGRRGTPPLASLVITLGLSVAAYAAEIAIWGDQPVSFTALPGGFVLAGAHLLRQYLLVIGVAIAALGALGGFFALSYAGKGMTACASNRFAAQAVGINVRRMGLLAFALGGLLGGLAGVLLIPIQPLSFNSDVGLAVSGFAAAIFGGLRSFPMALLGGLVLGVAESLIAGYWLASYQTVVALGLMLLLMVWQARRRAELA